MNRPQYWTLDNWDSIPKSLRGKKMRLLTPSEIEQLPKGTHLVSVNGERLIWGRSEIYLDDTRFGYSPYGILNRRLK